MVFVDLFNISFFFHPQWWQGSVTCRPLRPDVKKCLFFVCSTQDVNMSKEDCRQGSDVKSLELISFHQSYSMFISNLKTFILRRLKHTWLLLLQCVFLLRSLDLPPEWLPIFFSRTFYYVVYFFLRYIPSKLRGVGCRSWFWGLYVFFGRTLEGRDGSTVDFRRCGKHRLSSGSVGSQNLLLFSNKFFFFCPSSIFYIPLKKPKSY